MTLLSNKLTKKLITTYVRADVNVILNDFLACLSSKSGKIVVFILDSFSKISVIKFVPNFGYRD